MTPPFPRVLRLLAGVCLVAWGLMAAPAQALEESQTREFTLENGMRVLLVRDAKAPVVVSHLWYRVGSADNPPGKGGLAHMLEHMMFQGTHTVPPEEFSKIIARLGGDDNAVTSLDATYYLAKIASDRLEPILEMEADRMRGLRVQEKEFLSENLVVREERRLRIDSTPDGVFEERLQRLLYGDHPYGRSAIGTMQELEGMTVEDLRAFYRQYYAPNNATLVLVGDVDLEKTPELVRRHFAPLPPSPELHRPPWPKDRPTPAVCRLKEHDPRVKVSQYHMAFPAPSLTQGASEAEVYALDVLATLLADGRSSRLHRTLVTRLGLAVAVDTSYGGTALGPERFIISVTPAPGADLARLEREIGKELLRLAREEVEPRELEKARNTIMADHVYSLDSTSDIATTLGHLMSNGLDWRYLLTYGDRIRAVTALQVRAAAQRLTREKTCVGILLPGKKGKKP